MSFHSMLDEVSAIPSTEISRLLVPTRSVLEAAADHIRSPSSKKTNAGREPAELLQDRFPHSQTPDVSVEAAAVWARLITKKVSCLSGKPDGRPF